MVNYLVAKDKHYAKRGVHNDARTNHNNQQSVVNLKQFQTGWGFTHIVNFSLYLRIVRGLQLAFRYLRYLIDSKTRYDVHSPFVFDFIENILKDARHFYAFDEIEFLRAGLLSDNTLITIDDKGAGSRNTHSNKRKVSEIASTSLSTKKDGELLFRITNFFKPANTLELGTSLGISALCIAKGNPGGIVTTIEGSKEIASVANSVFYQAAATNIVCIVDEFSKALKSPLIEEKKFELIYIDGNHREEPTVQYFETLLSQHSTPETIFIFDDIHWSRGMEMAWKRIQSHSRVTLTIDLFFKGIVFVSSDFHEKQNLVLKY